MVTGLLGNHAAARLGLAQSRQATPGQRLRMLTLVTLFLTFDLVLFGAFTRPHRLRPRLSGLARLLWPRQPAGAKVDIAAAQAALPSGPVTFGKAWVEMIHRYLATGWGADTGDHAGNLA